MMLTLFFDRRRQEDDFSPLVSDNLAIAVPDDSDAALQIVVASSPMRAGGTWLQAHAMARILADAPLDAYGTAVLAFLRACPPTMRVAIWRHAGLP